MAFYCNLVMVTDKPFFWSSELIQTANWICIPTCDSDLPKYNFNLLSFIFYLLTFITFIFYFCFPSPLYSTSKNLKLMMGRMVLISFSAFLNGGRKEENWTWEMRIEVERNYSAFFPSMKPILIVGANIISKFLYVRKETWRAYQLFEYLWDTIFLLCVYNLNQCGCAINKN